MMRNIAVFVCCPLCPVRAGACKSNSHSLKRDHNPHQQQHHLHHILIPILWLFVFYMSKSKGLPQGSHIHGHGESATVRERSKNAKQGASAKPSFYPLRTVPS
ncbi:uncharacterized protein TrAFT101_001407 [Trichoderma asperellum]|uniref:uncharacterized protein n=1 Tax=Trichoderma asperellum TaxID=101201 RepID=UPI00332D8AC5|nr:hypothetical protein TrAFT101_001407 [Trichoderma asperellum]